MKLIVSVENQHFLMISPENMWCLVINQNWYWLCVIQCYIQMLQIIPTIALFLSRWKIKVNDLTHVYMHFLNYFEAIQAQIIIQVTNYYLKLQLMRSAESIWTNEMGEWFTALFQVPYWNWMLISMPASKANWRLKMTHFVWEPLFDSVRFFLF